MSLPGTPCGRLRGVALAVAGTAAALALAGCTSDPAAEGGPPSASPSRSARPLVVSTSVTRVAGRLSPARRDRVAREAGEVLSGYLGRAFVGTYPLEAPAAAFGDFTPGARALARKDLDLLTGEGLADAASVRATRAVAYLAVLAPEGRLVGATARVELDLRVEGGTPRTVRFRGRLMLTPTDAGWRIFGYDVSRSGAGPKGGS